MKLANVLQPPVERSCAKVEAVGPSQCASLNETRCEERWIAQRHGHFGRSVDERREVVDTHVQSENLSKSCVPLCCSIAINLIIVGSRNSVQRPQGLGVGPILLQFLLVIEASLSH